MGVRNNKQKHRQQMLKLKILWMMVAFVATVVILVTGTKLIWGSNVKKESGILNEDKTAVDDENKEVSGDTFAEHKTEGTESNVGEENIEGTIEIEQTDISGTIDAEENVSNDNAEDTVPDDPEKDKITDNEQPQSDLPENENSEEKQDASIDNADKNEEESKEEKKYLALTFDDGPYPKVTNRILDVLEENGAKATFFVMGNRLDTNGDTYKDAVKRAYSLGCQIGNHTYSHKDLTKLSVNEIKKEVSRANENINAIVPMGDAALRPPYGARNDKVYSTVNVPMITWSVDPEDWKSKDRDTVVKNIMDTVSDGDIVLMHDLYESTADAVEIVVPKLIEMGYELVTVDELFEVKGVTLKAGSLYRRPSVEQNVAVSSKPAQGNSEAADNTTGADNAATADNSEGTDKAVAE